jgi:hypothetical protein
MSGIPSLERVAFFSGQSLGASDLTALQRWQRELRWLHNRSLHAWGIAEGLAASGRRGDSRVTVEPGYAVDALGREILLAEPRSLDVPAVAGTAGGGAAVYYLVAAYVPDARQSTLETRDGVCHPGGAVRLADDPRLAWRKPEEVEDGRELVLAKARVRQCRLDRDLDTAVRRDAKASLQPYVAAGKTLAGATAWEAWTDAGNTLGVAVTVSTAGARFRATPRYLVQVEGERFLAGSPGPLLAVAFPSVTGASSAGFTVQVALPKMSGALVNPAALRNKTTAPGIVRDKLLWRVVWTGIEG